MERFSGKLSNEVLAFTRMFDLITDLIFLMEAEDESFRYVYVNQTALDIMKPDKDIIGCRIEDVLSLGLSDELIPNYHKAFQTQKPITFISSLTKDEHDFIGEVSLTPIQPNYIVAIVRDVTERVHNEKEILATKLALEKDQKRLSSLKDNNGDAVFELDLKGHFISMNTVATQITGFTEDEVIGKSFFPFFKTEIHEELNSYLAKVLNGHKIEFETIIDHKTGNQIDLFVRVIPITVDGELVGVFGIAADITEEKRMEKLLQESEQRYKSLFDNHPDAIFSHDIHSNFIRGNDSVERITGYSNDELAGNSIMSLVLPEYYDKTVYHFNRSIQNKESEEYELRIRHKKGHLVDITALVIPVIVDGQVVGVHGIAKDVTETKRAERTLRETKEALEVFWTFSVDPVFFINLKGDILKVNPAFEKIFEYTEEEVVVLKNSIVPADLKNDPLDIDGRLANGETVISHETKRVTKNGKLLDVLASYTPVRDETGKIVGAIAFYKDLTEMRRAEKELNKSQENFRLISENAFDVIQVVNTSGIIEYASPSNERMLGYKASELVGQLVTNFTHPEDLPILVNGYKQLMVGEHLNPFEFRILHQKGHYIWMEVSTTPHIENGDIQQLVAIARDITERKALSDELSKMAFIDYLSGLPNRRTFDDRLDVALEHAKSSQRMVALLMLDGHKFKQINDTFGHDVGDLVIKELAQRLLNSVRKTDTVARLGGDEMGIILPVIDSVHEAEEIAKRILKSLEEPFFLNGHSIQIGAGVGISVYPFHSTYKKQLIKYADMALYEAKKSAASEYRLYQP